MQKAAACWATLVPLRARGEQVGFVGFFVCENQFIVKFVCDYDQR